MIPERLNITKILDNTYLLAAAMGVYIGKLIFGIALKQAELKLSRKLKQANDSQKCRGQIEDYHKQFGKNLILVVAGVKAEMDDKYVSSAIEKAASLGIKSYRMFPH